jgi:hypothetical protein
MIVCMMLFVLSGCVGVYYDPEISKSGNNVSFLLGKYRLYKNGPVYVTDSPNGSKYAELLSGYFGDSSSEIEDVGLTVSGSNIVVDYYDENHRFIRMKLFSKDDFEIEDGKIVLKKDSKCEGGVFTGGPITGCSRDQLILSENDNGDLAVVSSGGYGGLFLMVLPMGAITGHLTIYQRITDISKYPQLVIPKEELQSLQP